jgi:methionine synthase II (cobalamin-independent)
MASISDTPLPSGIITFMFSDIEGSTPLWERDPEGMRAALARHNAIIHEVVADRIERVVTAVGDPERVIAGTDCGFETTAGSKMVVEEVVWAKLRSLAEGAAIASKRLLG